MALQISGFVKNLPNGSVEMEAEGEDPGLTDLLHWCHHGPPGARVDRVNVEWLPPNGAGAAFSVQG
jgi:acylphosphatase